MTTINAISLADGKIITTSQRASFHLFSLEEGGWTESIVESPEDRIFTTEQLVTVRNPKTRR